MKLNRYVVVLGSALCLSTMAHATGKSVMITIPNADAAPVVFTLPGNTRMTVSSSRTTMDDKKVSIYKDADLAATLPDGTTMRIKAKEMRVCDVPCQ